MFQCVGRGTVDSMRKLTTDFVKIGQSGPTADNRSIEASWLTEAAESYDPDQYISLIWPEHFRFYGNAGKVVELKAEEADGVTSLYAKLQPGEQLLAYNKSGQKLFTSMELTPNFADSGKYYLTGLGVTDQPASLGTHELLFSCRKQKKENVILCGVQLPENLTESVDDSEPPSWFKKFMFQLGGNAPQTKEKEPEKFNVEDTDKPMNEEQFNKLLGSVTDLGKKFTDLSASMAQGKNEVPEVGKDQPAETVETEKFTEISTQLTALTAKVEEFTSRLEGAAGATPVPENDGAAAEGGIL